MVAVLFDDFRLMDFTSKDFAALGKVVEARKAVYVILDEAVDGKVLNPLPGDGE